MSADALFRERQDIIATPAVYRRYEDIDALSSGAFIRDDDDDV